jgi:hypothetical protein
MFKYRIGSYIGTKMHNGNRIRNYNCISKRLKHWTDNYIYLVLNAFHHIHTAFNTILSKCNSNKSCKSHTCPSSDAQILPFRAFKSNKIHFTERSLIFQASEKIHSIGSDGQNGTRSSIVERSICLEMNKTEFLSESGE